MTFFRDLLRRGAYGPVGRAAERLAPGGPALAVLVYHRVVRERRRDPWALAVTLDHFREQIQALRERWPIVPLDQGLHGALAGKLPAKHAVAITFDDGYRDNLTNARPVLDVVAAPATLFVATGCVSKDASFWWDRLDDAQARGLAASATSVTDSRTGQSLDPPPGADPYEWAKSVPAHVRDRWLQAAGIPQRVGGADDQPLSTEELRELGASLRIAGHGHEHGSLGRVPRTDAARDLTTCMYTLRHLAAAPLAFLAYPFGGAADVSGDAVSAAREAGFEAGFTTARGVVRRGAEPMRLPGRWADDVPGDHLVATLTRAFLAS